MKALCTSLRSAVIMISGLRNLPVLALDHLDVWRYLVKSETVIWMSFLEKQSY